MNYMKHSFYSTKPAPAPTSSSILPDHLKNSSSAAKTTSSLNSCVRFNDISPRTQTFDEREKYLTAKYPQQQMQLIRKRLKVEFWLDDQLRYLYNVKDDSTQDEHDQCPEDLIDCLLDMDNDTERRRFLIEKLRNAKQSRSITMEFIDELLHRVKML